MHSARVERNSEALLRASEAEVSSPGGSFVLLVCVCVCVCVCEGGGGGW